MKKSMPLWCEDCRFVLFWNGIGEAHADPEWFKKNTTNVYSIHLEMRMALPCQISAGIWKYVNPCLDFLGIPDQRTYTAYGKRQVRPGWTYVRRSSVTPTCSYLWYDMIWYDMMWHPMTWWYNTTMIYLHFINHSFATQCFLHYRDRWSRL